MRKKSNIISVGVSVTIFSQIFLNIYHQLKSESMTFSRLWLYYREGKMETIFVFEIKTNFQLIYSSVRVIASRILHEISLLIGELAIRGTKLTLNASLGTKSNLLIEQYCY